LYEVSRYEAKDLGVNFGNDPRANIPSNPYTSRWTAERPSEVNGEYQPKQEQGARTPLKTAGGILATLAILFAKFKSVVLIFLNFKWLLLAGKFFTFGWTFLLSLWLYALLFGWKFGVIFVLMIAAHEFGHYIAFRLYGLHPKLPTFIPLLGAFTAGNAPLDAQQEAYIALAGPFTGLIVSIIAYAYGAATGDNLWIAAASVGAFLNLLNMIPAPPFDGRGIAAAFSPRVWLIGIVLFVALMLLLHISVVFLILIAIFGVPRALAAFKGQYDPAYYAIKPLSRLTITAAYLVTAASLVYLMNIAHVATRA